MSSVRIAWWSTRARLRPACVMLLAALAGIFLLPSPPGGASQALVVSATERSPTPRFPTTLRVGLASDLAELSGLCCLGAELRQGDRALVRDRPVVLRPAAGASDLGRYRLQVAALKDEAQATALAARLRTLLDQPADSVFDAGSDLYKVRVGDYRSRDLADAARPSLVELGQGGAWIVHEDRGIASAGLRVLVDGETRSVAGRWLTISTSSQELRFRQGRYRGRLLVYLNDRGKLNLINELSLEDYLRGVVPAELGPELYPELEALKAQAVAARSYTLRNLGAFAAEGYDICATPGCQVYRGIGAEHPLSDQAIAETEGEVLLYDGELAEALYSATCGGHTEDVEVVFPDKKADYLRGVTCLERGRYTLPSTTTAPIERALIEQLLPGKLTHDPSAVGRRLRELAQLAGLPLGRDRLVSLRATELRRFLLSTFDLVLDPRLLSSSAHAERLILEPPPDLSPADLELARRLQQLGLLEPGLRSLNGAEIDRLTVWMARRLGLLVELEAHFRELSQGQLRLRLGREELTVPLGEEVAAYYQPTGGESRPADLELLPGDRVSVFTGDGRALAVVHRQPQQRLDRRAPVRPPWTRLRTDRQIARAVESQYPGFRFRSFEVIERGVSERIGRIRLHGADGSSVDIRGLAVRWLFEVPDTLFEAQRVGATEATPGWLFTGRGRGHGVGLCQVGAYGMALRGLDYRQILGHYYTGIELRSAPVGVRPRAAP